MKSSRFSPDFIQNIKVSFLKFKFICSLYPDKKQFYVWVFKNFLTVKGQEALDQLRLLFLEDPWTYPQLTINQLEDEVPGCIRFSEYLKNTSMQEWLPMSAFPLVEVEPKDKMKYCFIPYEMTQDKLNFVRNKLYAYLYSIGPREIFVPPADVLFKVGNQKYNDGGVVRYDYERPQSSFGSSFKLQKFITQPLTPREVWLPGKAIKMNNSFWMTITRQILDVDPVYPSSDENAIFERLNGRRELLKFDISGFGLQFIREYIILAAEIVAELYPCEDLDEQLALLIRIFERVEVELEDGTFVYPPRGIGLGYYEDLKTIVMMALLRDFDPISVYGDQGLLGYSGLEAIPLLSEYFFTINFEKVEFLSTGEKPSIMWAGRRIAENKIEKPREFLDPLFGAFFARYHWERKASLFSLAESYPSQYRLFDKKIRLMYERIHGYEFFPNDSYKNLFNCGVSITAPVECGYSNLWRVEDLTTPVTNISFDTTYVSPFIPSKPRSVPHKLAKQFQIRRKQEFRSTPFIDDDVYRYTTPRIIYNKKSPPPSKLLPGWAEMLYLAHYRAHTGTLVSGLTGDEIINAVNRQSYSSDPFRARATGGYKVLTSWRAPPVPSEEQVEIATFFMNIPDQRSLKYVRRADLTQSPGMMQDSLYFNEDLMSYSQQKKKEDLITVAISKYNDSLEDVYNHLLESLRESTTEDALLSLIPEDEREYIFDQNISEHEDIASEDDDYYGEMADISALDSLD